VQALSLALQDRCQDLKTEDLLDLVALGTIADSVAMVDENRVFVTYGLKQMNGNTCRMGIKELKESTGLDKDFRSELLSFTLIPRINAAGRLDDAGEVVELFLTEDRAKARGISGLLNDQNRKRKVIETSVFKSAIKMIEAEEPGHAIVLHSPEWHAGVIGIVASRLVDMFHKPVFLFSVKDSVAKGSARGIPTFHLYNAVAECSDILLGYGGHRQAAGMKIAEENLHAFKERINAIAEKHLSDKAGRPTLEIDASVKLRDINFNLIQEITLMEPFGDSNREPVFGSKDIHILNHRIVGNNHLKMQLRQESTHMDTIGFSMGRTMEDIGPADLLDIAFVPAINEWNGTRSLQLNLKAIRPGTQ
jgi:single-stranded-DNA-specific exonuclease